MVNEHEVRLARDETLTWEQAIERLRLAEHARQETDRQQGRGGRRIYQQDVAFVENEAAREQPLTRTSKPEQQLFSPPRKQQAP